MPTSEEVKRQKILRGKFLDKLYDLSLKTNRADGLVNTAEVVQHVTPNGLPDADVERLVRELKESGLVEIPKGYRQVGEAYEPLIRLTPYGKSQVEEWVVKETEPTPQIPVPHSFVTNIVTVARADGSNFVIGSNDTTVNSTSSLGASLETISELMKKILQHSEAVDAEGREELEDDVRTLDEQAQSNSPSISRVRTVLRRFHKFLLGAGGAAHAGALAGLTQQAEHLVGQTLGQLSS